jgi:hypothetical protein
MERFGRHNLSATTVLSLLYTGPSRPIVWLIGPIFGGLLVLLYLKWQTFIVSGHHLDFCTT